MSSVPGMMPSSRLSAVAMRYWVTSWPPMSRLKCFPSSSRSAASISGSAGELMTAFGGAELVRRMYSAFSESDHATLRTSQQDRAQSLHQADISGLFPAVRARRSLQRMMLLHNSSTPHPTTHADHQTDPAPTNHPENARPNPSATRD